MVRLVSQRWSFVGGPTLVVSCGKQTDRRTEHSVVHQNRSGEKTVKLPSSAFLVAVENE
jgi:hypothetical protein